MAYLLLMVSSYLQLLLKPRPLLLVPVILKIQERVKIPQIAAKKGELGMTWGVCGTPVVTV